jgi:hypothetical protein
MCVLLVQTIDDPTNKKTAGRTKGRAGHLNDPLPTSIPLPPGLTRMYMVVLFVCRAMRTIWQKGTKSPDTPLPDRVVGLAGSSNKVLASKTFTEVIRKLGMCHFGIPRWGPYSIRNEYVTDVFRRAYEAEVVGGRGAAQEMLVNAMNIIHSSLDAAISNYNQFVKADNRSFKHRLFNNINSNGSTLGDTADLGGEDDDRYMQRRGGGRSWGGSGDERSMYAGERTGVDPTVAALLKHMKEQNERQSKQLKEHSGVMNQVLEVLAERRKARHDVDSDVEEVPAKRVRQEQASVPAVQSAIVPSHMIGAAQQYMFHMHMQFQQLAQQVAHQLLWMCARIHSTT